MRLTHYGTNTGTHRPVTAEVCPKSTSEWAKEILNFQPNPKQAEVLDAQAKYLILCCNRQWGKTTVVALKALHTAIYQPKTEIVVISKSLKQAGLLIAKVRECAATLVDLKIHDYR